MKKKSNLSTFIYCFSTWTETFFGWSQLVTLSKLMYLQRFWAGIVLGIVIVQILESIFFALLASVSLGNKIDANVSTMTMPLWMTKYLSLPRRPEFFNLRLRLRPPNFLAENFHLSRSFRKLVFFSINWPQKFWNGFCFEFTR